ncbi:hypothetical protein L0Z72_12805 [candidate division KSB1 bacterium]|nr:hypothetical protein [candidate division KSB1 bacterium]
MKRLSFFLFGGLLILMFVIVMSCAGKKLPAWGDAENGYVLSYRPTVGDIYCYEKTMEGTNSMERMGQTFESTSSQTFIFQLETEKVDTAISFIMTVDTIGYSFESQQGMQKMDFGDIKGKKIRATMTPKGIARDIVPIDSLPTPKMGDRPMEGEAKGWLSVPLFKVPDRLFKVGDSWTEAKLDTNTHTDTTRQFTRTFINDSKSKYTILGEETKLGLSCLHIQVETEYATQSWGTMRGTEMNSEGSGETTSHAWFAYKEGILVEHDTETFYEGTTAFSGQMNMTSPNTNESKSSLKLVKWIPVKKSGD